MSCYSFEHIVKECYDEKAAVLTTARGKTTGAKLDIYANSWIALNAWIESRLSQQKGARISGFATFCWEMLEKDGETHCRPLFLLDDNFVKTNRIKRKRIHYPPQLTPIEEINFSLLAIKFSRSLTKDMIFSGIRDITRKIGDFIQRGYQLEIEFTFGILTAKENRVKFTFNQQRLLEILPENAEFGVYRHNDGPMKYIEPLDTDRSRASTAPASGRRSVSSPTTNEDTVKKPLIPTLDFTRRGISEQQQKAYSFANTSLPESAPTSGNNNTTAAALPPKPSHNHLESSLKLQSSASFNSFAASTAKLDKVDPETFTAQAEKLNVTNSENAVVTPNPELRAILDAIGGRHLSMNKDEFRKKAKERVISQSFNRCLEEVENVAKLEDFKRYEERKQYETWKQNEMKKREKQLKESKELKDTLDSQLEFSRDKHENEKFSRTNAVATFFLPETAGQTKLSFVVDENGNKVDSRKIIARELQQRIEENMKATKQQKSESTAKEKEFIEKLNLETEIQTIVKRADHLAKQKELLEAWEQDGHIRNLRKLQNHGKEIVTDYIDRNLVELNATMNTFSPSLNSSLNMSIGFDSRKGKI